MLELERLVIRVFDPRVHRRIIHELVQLCAGLRFRVFQVVSQVARRVLRAGAERDLRADERPDLFRRRVLARAAAAAAEHRPERLRHRPAALALLPPRRQFLTFNLQLFRDCIVALEPLRAVEVILRLVPPRHRHSRSTPAEPPLDAHAILRECPAAVPLAGRVIPAARRG